MDVELPPDFREFLRFLDAERVEYLLIGGYAVSFHGYPPTTEGTEIATAPLRKKRPLSFAIVGREENQEAEDLLQLIKDTILSSSFAIFDATYGNPNVSLEYGFAEAHDIQRALYLSTHAAAQKSKDPAIIADLAGKKRNHYAQEKGLLELLSKFAAGHPYTLRFERFLRAKYKNASKGKKHRARTLALKVVHSLDGH